MIFSDILAENLLDMYLRTPDDDQSENFKLVIKFIIQVYAKIFFKIKWQPKIELGPSHLLELMKSSR